MGLFGKDSDDRLDDETRARKRDLSGADSEQLEREGRVTRSEEELAVGKRSVKAGEVGVRKTVETERVRQAVPVSHEEVTIERRPISPDTPTDDATIGQKEIRIPLMAEEAVVEKRVVPKEEVVIRKQAVSENQTVEADVRRERIDVDRQGAVERTDDDLRGRRR